MSDAAAPASMTTLAVGGFRITLPSDDPVATFGLPDTYVPFLEPGRGDAADLVCLVDDAARDAWEMPDTLVVAPGRGAVRFPGFDSTIDLDQRAMSVRATLDGLRANLDYALRVAVALLAFRSGGLLMHGAGIRHGGRGFLFLGPSGTGKTTVSRMSTADVVLNDDLNVLRPAGEGWMMWGTPFWNPSQVRPSAAACPLHRIVRLVQDRAASTEAMSAALATAALVSSVPVLASAGALADAVFERCARVAAEVPVVRLRFGLNPEFWGALDALDAAPSA